MGNVAGWAWMAVTKPSQPGHRHRNYVVPIVDHFNEKHSMGQCSVSACLQLASISSLLDDVY